MFKKNSCRANQTIMNTPGHCWRCEAACTQLCARCRVAFYCSKGCQKQDKWRHKPDCDAAVLTTQCLSCGLKQEGMLKCSNCLEATYCGAECQRNDWARHKVSCQETVEKTLKLVEEMKKLQEMKERNAGLLATYYWGNLPAVDLLNLSMNEGEAYSDPLALLLCGVGDPRNVLLTIASLPDVYKQQVTFVLNDICPCTLARTILLLYMLLKGGDDVTGTVVRVWYSVRISEKDFALLTSALQDLVTATELRNLTGAVMDVSADQLSLLKNVWTTWLRLSQRKGAWVEELRQLDIYSSNSEKEDGLGRYMHAIPIKHRISAQHFFDTGIFHSSTNTTGLTRQNATLTGRGFHHLTANSDFHYSIPPDVLPFTGWDYKVIKKTCYAASLPKMYTIFMKQIFQKALKKLTSDQVKLHMILCDVQNVEPFLPMDLRYDRITTSNLWDYCPLAALLTKFKALVNESNPHAVMLTETDNWPRNFMPDVIHVLPYIVGIDVLCDRAFKDTGNRELVHLSGLSTVVEYLDLSSEFRMILRASLLASYTEKELATFKRKKIIPSMKSLVSSLGLQLRDFSRNENTVFPFKWALNCRRVVMIRGYERALEWKLVGAGSLK